MRRRHTISEAQRPPTEPPTPEKLAELARRQRALRPGFFVAVAKDARLFSVKRREQFQFTGRAQKWIRVLRFLWGADEFLSLVPYRLRTSLWDAGIPILPRLLHYASSFLYGVRIDDHVVIEAGIYLPHGQVVISGITRIGPGCYVAPFTAIGHLHGGAIGPKIGSNVQVGTGAKILGKLTIGNGARIGTNAVVLKDVPAGATAVGVPARIIQKSEGVEA